MSCKHQRTVQVGRRAPSYSLKRYGSVPGLEPGGAGSTPARLTSFAFVFLGEDTAFQAVGRGSNPRRRSSFNACEMLMVACLASTQNEQVRFLSPAPVNAPSEGIGLVATNHL